MAYQSSNPRRRKRKQAPSGSAMLIACLVTVLIVLIGLSLVLRSLTAAAPAPSQSPAAQAEGNVSFWERLFRKDSEPAAEVPTEPENPYIVSTASIGATGDILMHMPVINTGSTESGIYDFSSIFQYLAPYTTELDYAVANLETTLCGTDNGYKYSGYPQFNCPDEIVDAARNAGFDMLLTANNHCYDTGEKGFLRTIRLIRSKGLENLGGRLDDKEDPYTIVELQGIKVGMYCCTYVDNTPAGGDITRTYLNGIPIAAGSENLVNTFDPEKPEAFYSTVSETIKTMKEKGAEAIVIFIHWGTEYELAANAVQQNMAQKLCDFGADVIVGGHPHVVQPVSLLTSHLDPDHRTVCLYSMGNAVSNQRRYEMNLNTGHTEDGVLFTMTFAKYSDGRVLLNDVDLIPLWVNGVRSDGKTAMDKKTPIFSYPILPLDMNTVVQWSSLYNLDDDANEMAVKSLERTEAIVGAGLTKARDFLSEQRYIMENGEPEPTEDAA